MMIYFTSDLHFNHKRIIQSVGRPFANLEEMHNALVNNWNSVVNDDDTIYILGDFTIGAFFNEYYGPQVPQIR